MNYVLITPARNEAAFLPMVISSILAQTIRPHRWVIVSDGSTDGTDDIARTAAAQHDFIRFLRSEGRSTRGFGSKAVAFRAGRAVLGTEDYAYIGNLDADITFEPGYYERMLAEMEKNPRLGVASGVCWDKTPTGFKCVTISLNHAVGAVQFFRRECFDQIGGYRPTTVGGVDSLAELLARMHRWQTQAFADLPVYHHKPVDSASGGKSVRICYRAGQTEYHIGSHPLFAIAKAVRRWRQRPMLGSVFIRLYAYFKLSLFGAHRDAPEELVEYLKSEQLGTLRAWLLRRSATPHSGR